MNSFRWSIVEATAAAAGLSLFFFFSRRPMLSSFAAQTEWTKQKLLLIRAVVQLLMRGQVGEMTEHSVRDGPLKVFLDTSQPFVLRWYPKQFEIKVKKKKKVQKRCHCTFRKVASLILLCGALGQEKISLNYTAWKEEVEDNRLD